MNCFNHPNIVSVGTCKACSKGLCNDCLTDLGHGLACKGVHEELVESYNTIISKNAKAYDNVEKNVIVAPLFYLFMGIVFAGFGYHKYGTTNLIFILGVGFIVFSVIVYRRNKAMFQSEKEET